MESFLNNIIDFIVTVMGGFLVWIWNNLKEKATKKELDEVKGELKELRTKVYDTLQNLATKEDINRLDAKLDRWTERELTKK